MDLRTARAIVSETGWLSEQPAEFRNELLSQTTLKSYAKGEYVYHLEDPPGMMFGVAGGAVLIGVAHPILGLHQAHLGRPGDWYGEAAALHGVNRRVAVEAPVPAQILCLSTKSVQKMLEEQPRWQKNLSALLLWNQDKAVRAAADLLIRDPRARVCARLLTLCGARAGKSLPGGPIELPLTQDQFAMMCGLSRKSVHLALNQLQAKGVCENRYGGIVVVNAEALGRILVAFGTRRTVDKFPSGVGRPFLRL
jgi:CRP-like cAMP-binding protein